MGSDVRILAALGHCVEVLDDLKPSGHSGDEETGEHDADCMLCRVEAALAHAEEIGPATDAEVRAHPAVARRLALAEALARAVEKGGAVGIIVALADYREEVPRE